MSISTAKGTKSNEAFKSGPGFVSLNGTHPMAASIGSTDRARMVLRAEQALAPRRRTQLQVYQLDGVRRGIETSCLLTLKPGD